MPTRGRRCAKTYKSAENYLNRITIYHPDQDRLKTQLLEIFGHGEEDATILRRIRREVNDGPLVSMEVVPSPKVYLSLRGALQSIGVRLRVSVLDTTAGSFVAKRIIATILQNPEDKVKGDSLLLNYRNLRKLVVNSNKDILSESQQESTRLGA